VRATATLAARYLERRDRVGLVSFGGVLRWLTPGMGTTQQYRIVDALLESEIVFNYAWKDVSVIPSRVLPPQALVVAVTPLLDDRAIEALADLRSRRYDLAIERANRISWLTGSGCCGARRSAPATGASASRSHRGRTTRRSTRFSRG
jgi:uncharacterized protein (DUF58 family)